MRAARVWVVGMGALLAGCIAVACSSSSGEGGEDAGSLDAFFTPEDAATPETSTISFGRDGGDATAVQGTDASSPSTDDASDSTVPGADGGTDAASVVDASDAGQPSSDASDAAQSAFDASDAGSPPDAADSGSEDAGEDSSAGEDAAAIDSGGEDAGASVNDDAGDASEDASEDASDGAVACVSCGSTVTYLGGAAGFVSSSGSPVTLTGGGTVPDGDALSVVVQTYPKGSAAVHAVYATSSSFSGATDVVMTYDTNQPNPSNDQWYVILPVQSASTTVYFYLYAAGCDCTTVLYDPGGFTNFTYTEE
jgi:hypothetical protein